MRTMHSVLIGLAAVSLVSCASGHMGHHGGADAPLAQEVRRATERYQDVKAATAAGYALFLGCVSSPQGGAMGIHYVNGDLVGDGKLDAARPEALMYEPKGGKLELVGVEYIVIAAAWDAANKTPPFAHGAALPPHLEPEPLRDPGVLCPARVGVAGQPARRIRGLEPAGVVRGAHGRRRALSARHVKRPRQGCRAPAALRGRVGGPHRAGSPRRALI